jgi:hypothetical protein
METEKMIWRDAVIVIEAVLNSNIKLNETEKKFINDIQVNKQSLTPAQSRWLNSIYAKAYGGGIFVKKEVIGKCKAIR